MPSIQSRLIRSFILKPMIRLFDPEQTPIDRMRMELIHKAKSLPLPRDIIIERTRIGNIDAEWVSGHSVTQGDNRTILFFHGGGTTGSCETHRNIAAWIYKSSGIRLLTIEYRLAPEHKYPAANEDCLAAYQWLIKQGIPGNRIVLGGDSWGAALVLMTLLSVRDDSIDLPAAAFLLSPWDPAKFEAKSYTTRAAIDPYCSLKGFQTTAEYYFDVAQPFPSLFEQDLHGLPPLLIQVGEHEVIFDDAVLLAKKAKEAGVDVRLEVWNNMCMSFKTWH